MLLLLPQRYEFSSKSQPIPINGNKQWSCCCYRKGTNFQANHNHNEKANVNAYVVVATAKVRIFKQITTPAVFLACAYSLLLLPQRYEFSSKSQRLGVGTSMSASCCCYRKGTNFQANHNSDSRKPPPKIVVVATAKVRIFKQITTQACRRLHKDELLLLPQRYEFSSKSQPM